MIEGRDKKIILRPLSILKGVKTKVELTLALKKSKAKYLQ